MTEEEFYSFKRELYKWAKQNLRGKSVKNEPTGNIIEISSQGIDEWFSKSKTEEQVKSIKMRRHLNIMNVQSRLRRKILTPSSA